MSVKKEFPLDDRWVLINMIPSNIPGLHWAHLEHPDGFSFTYERPNSIYATWEQMKRNNSFGHSA